MERKFKIKNFLFFILSFFFNNKSFFVKNFKKIEFRKLENFRNPIWIGKLVYFLFVLIIIEIVVTIQIYVLIIFFIKKEGVSIIMCKLVYHN